jgi:predicted RNA-binding protein
MCEATAYLLKDGEQELILENVDLFETGDEEIRLVDIFGEEKKLKARVKSLSLVDHKIILESLND